MHSIRNSILILVSASLCSKNSLNSSWHGFHKMLETFLWDSRDFSDALSYCGSLVLPHPKGVLLDSDLVTGKATEEH